MSGFHHGDEGWTVVQILSTSTIVRSFVEHNFTDGWHAKLGRAVAEHTEFETECWLVDYEYDERREVHDGIPYRLLDSTRLRPRGELSVPLLRAMRRRASGADRVAFSLHPDWALHSRLVPRLFSEHCRAFPNTPVFLHHHGGLDSVPVLDHPRIKRFAYTPTDHVFVLTEAKRRHYVDQVGLDPSRVSIQTMGVDVDTFRPMDTDPSDLGIEAEHLLVYVGGYDEKKGLDAVLRAFERFRERTDSTVALALLGGNDTDSLYSEAAAMAGVHPVTAYIDGADGMARWYSAANAYVSFPDERVIAAGESGIISPAEALACGTPLVSTILHHVPEHLRDGVGILPADERALPDALARILAGTADPDACRRTAIAAFSWENVAEHVGTIYADTFANY